MKIIPSMEEVARYRETGEYKVVQNRRKNGDGTPSWDMIRK